MTLGNQLCRGMIHILHMASKAQMLTLVSGGPRTENFRNPPPSQALIQQSRQAHLEGSESQPGLYFSRDLKSLRAYMRHARVHQDFVMALACSGESLQSLAKEPRIAFQLEDTPWEGGYEAASHLYPCGFFISRADLSEASCVCLHLLLSVSQTISKPSPST